MRREEAVKVAARLRARAARAERHHAVKLVAVLPFVAAALAISVGIDVLGALADWLRED
jgi:hypothetical protein